MKTKIKLSKTNLILALLVVVFSATAIFLAVKYLGQNDTSTEQNTKGDDANMVYATMETNFGTIKLKLNKEKAPISTENFVKYAQSGFYDNTVSHRVIPGFMVQLGGFSADGSEKETLAPIKNEAKNGLSNKRGTIAMARTNVVDSATSQFFINLVDNNFLDYKNDANYGYAVFGEVVSGMDVVDKIAQVETSSRGPHDDWPIEDVVVTKVTISNN